MVSFVYMLARGSYKGKVNGANVKLFLKYLMSYKGQLIASTYFFSPLPSKVVAINNKGIQAIKV
jgi:ABC-type Fe3+ transport system substrate-binding protein